PRRRLQRCAGPLTHAARSAERGVGLQRARPAHRPHPRARRAGKSGARLAAGAAARRRPTPLRPRARRVGHRMSWPEQRARFPVLDRFAYLNSGTFGPLSRETLLAMAELRAWEGEHGRGGGVYFNEMLERRERVRALLADQIRVPADNV